MGKGRRRRRRTQKRWVVEKKKDPSLGDSDIGPHSKTRLVLNADDVAGLACLEVGRRHIS